jgi:hypothetical protein
MKKTFIKTMKTALRATAALAVVSTAAHADGLSELKAMFESVKLSDVVSQTAFQIPKGYTVKPTADSAPAEAEAVDEPFTEVKWSGYIKTGYIYSQVKDGTPVVGGLPNDSSRDFDVEAGLTVKGSVQSSLGEVGGTVQFKWDIAESTTNLASIALRDEGAIGFWQFADTMKLEMGRGNAGRLENGITKNTRRIWTTADRRVRTENAGNGFFDRDAYNGFLGLAYADGPISLSVRAHDATRGVTGPLGSDDDAIGASVKGAFTSDLINFEMAGGYWGQDDAKGLALASQTGVKWLAGAGTEINAIEGISISLAAQTGRLHNDTESVNFSGSVGFGLTDTISAGIGAGWRKVSNSPTLADNRTEKVINGGIYYAPMSQLIIGLEADWLDDGKPALTENDGFTGAVVSRYSF